MRCPECRSTAVRERPERTAQGYRRFRCVDCAKQFNERSGKLGSFFPDWEDWPQTLASATFEVTYNGTTVSIPATTTMGSDRVDTALGAADSVAWRVLFDTTTLVVGFEYRDLSPSVILSYDTVTLAESIEHLYGELARAATDRMPRVTELIETERWRGFINAVDRLDQASVDPHTGLRDPNREFDLLRGSVGFRAFTLATRQAVEPG